MITGGTQTCRLGDVVGSTRTVVSPQALGDQVVDHFSIPAFDLGNAPERVPASRIKSAKLLITDTTLLISRLNPHICRSWLATPTDGIPALASPEFLAVLETPAADLRYLYALSNSEPFQRSLRSLVTGTSSSHQRVKPRDCFDIEISLPAMDVQQAIGERYVAIDERIRIARAISKTADCLVAARFRDQFGAGSGGTQLGAIADVSFGVSYRSRDLHGDNQALVTLKCFGRSGEYRAAGLKAWNGEPRDDQVLRGGEIVVAKTDLTQAADVLGRATIVRRSAKYDKLVASLDLAVVRPQGIVNRAFVYGLLSQPEFKSHCRARANGTTVLHLSRMAIPDYGVQLPSRTQGDEFETVAEPLIQRMLLADQEAEILTTLRNAFIGDAFGRGSD